jgi:hypothetical protein
MVYVWYFRNSTFKESILVRNICVHEIKLGFESCEPLIRYLSEN